jgi:hypothetical protein
MATKKRKSDKIREIKHAVAAWLKHASELGYSFEQKGDDQFSLSIGLAKPDVRVNTLNSAHHAEIKSFFKNLMTKFYLIMKSIEEATDRLVLNFRLPVFTT